MHATPRRWRGRGRSWHARSRAPDRRARRSAEDGTGNVSYDPDNHDRMVRLRAQKVAGIAADTPRSRWTIRRRRAKPRPLVGRHVRAGRGGGWLRANERRRRRARAPSLPQPLPPQHGRGRQALREGARAQMNLGQLLQLVRQSSSRDAVGYNRVRGASASRRRGPRGDRGDAVSEGNGNPIKLTSKDFKSDQEVRWCPGCVTTRSSLRCRASCRS